MGVNIPTDEDHIEAASICARLGHHPLAIVLAAAFLAKHAHITLAEYDRQLQTIGLAPTLGTSRVDKRALATRHDTAVTRMWQQQWRATRRGLTRTLLSLASLLPASQPIPLHRLSLLTRVTRVDALSPFRRAVQELLDLHLMERLSHDQVRVHPLIHEFLAKRGARLATAATKNALARLTDVEWLHDAAISRGISVLLEDFRTLLLIAGVDPELHWIMNEQARRL
jgi:hypothetical protein